MAGLAAVVATGVDGGRTPDGASPGLWPEQWVIWVGLLALTLALVAVMHRLRPSGERRQSAGSAGNMQA